MSIERLAPAHLDAVVAIEARDGDVRWTRAHFEKELTLPVSRFYVLTDGVGEIQGYAGYWKMFEEAQLLNLVVARDHRRQGLGTQLVHYLRSDALLEGCVVMTLEVRKANAPAMALYQRLGFKEFGLRRQFYEDPVDDAVIMSTNIG